MQHELRKFIQENFMFGLDDFQLSPDDSLIEKGLIDSSGVLELIAFLEQKYAITIEDSELVPENLDSINALTRFIERKTRTDVHTCN
jgi:acyl carrier protein